jgi:hypothetical protein
MIAFVGSMRESAREQPLGLLSQRISCLKVVSESPAAYGTGYTGTDAMTRHGMVQYPIECEIFC